MTISGAGKKMVKTRAYPDKSAIPFSQLIFCTIVQELADMRVDLLKYRIFLG